MAEIQITTAQNVTIAFTAADIGERILAYIIDLLIKYSYIVVVFYSIGQFTSSGGVDFFENFDSDPWSVMAIVIIILSPAIFYTLVLETLLMGQTIGKKLMKVQVVKIDGYRANFLDYFIRWVMRFVDINVLSGIVAVITIGMTKNHQRLGGMSSGTGVISLKSKINISHTILQEVAEDYQPTYLSVIKLSDNDVRIIKENFLRAKKANDFKTILKLKDKIVEVIDEEPNQDTAETFIKRVIKDYNHFTKNM